MCWSSAASSWPASPRHYSRIGRSRKPIWGNRHAGRPATRRPAGPPRQGDDLQGRGVSGRQPGGAKGNEMVKRLLTTAAIAGLMSGMAAGAGLAADELPLGYLAAKTGPFVSLSRTNSIAVEMAVEEINAKGGVKGKKLKLITFDTAG